MTAQEREVARLARVYTLARQRSDAIAMLVAGTRMYRLLTLIAEAAAR